MRMLQHRFLAICILVLSFCAAPDLPAGNNSAWIDTYNDLKRVRAVPAVFMLRDTVRISLIDLEIVLHQGFFYRIEGVGEQPSGFLFKGSGTAAFTPRHRIESHQLARFTGDSTLTSRFDSFYLRSFSSRWEIDDALISAEPGQPDARQFEEMERAEQTLLEKLGYNFASRLLTEHMLGPSDFVLCYFQDIKSEPVFPPAYYYIFDPRSSEPVQFYQYRDRRLKKPFFTICRYPLGNYFDAPAPPTTLRITQHNGWVAVDDRGKLSADIGVVLSTNGRRLRSLYLQFSRKLKLDWITTVHGDTVSFIREEDEAGFTVLLPDSMPAADTLRLNFHYNGELLSRSRDGNWHLNDPIYWHPRLGYLQRSRYKIVFKYPPQYEIVSLGRRLREWEENGLKHTYFTLQTPAKANLFSIGKYRTVSTLGPDSTRIELFGNRYRGKGVLRDIARDAAESLYFFSRKITPYGLKDIRIVEGQGLESQGFPGLIKLSPFAFRSEFAKYFDALRSHEIAHQWWGNVVGWRTYRDQWLSEAFAEYMGAAFLEFTLPGSGLAEQLLNAWRDDLLEGGNIGVSLGLQRFGFSKAALRQGELLESGPVYLGIRLGQRQASDYYLLVYEKGAYILHMLRHHLTDDDTRSDARFWALLRDYCESYGGSDPTTRDFIALASRHAGEDMSWFFEQWLLRPEIPEYSYSTQQDAIPGGHGVSLNLMREGVAHDFVSILPVRITLPGGETKLTRVRMEKSQMRFEFGPFSVPPERVELDPEKTVLARVKRL